MKLTVDNFKGVVPVRNIPLCEALLIDLEDLNNTLENNCEEDRKLYIDYEMGHTEWNAERTDPCPDFYGTYSLRFEQDPSKTVGGQMTINELDDALYTLINFCEFKV